MTNEPQLPPAEALSFESLITGTPNGIASRVLAKTTGSNVTLGSSMVCMASSSGVSGDSV